MALPPIWWGETGGRREETETEQEKQRVRRKRPKRSVKPKGEAWGMGEHGDVISIDLQGERIFTVRYNCYHRTDRKEVGGLFTLKFNLIRHNNTERNLQSEIKVKLKEASENCRYMFSFMKQAGTANSLRCWGTASVPVHLYLCILITFPLYSMRAVFFFTFKKP